MDKSLLKNTFSSAGYNNKVISPRETNHKKSHYNAKSVIDSNGWNRESFENRSAIPQTSCRVSKRRSSNVEDHPEQFFVESKGKITTTPGNFVEENFIGDKISCFSGRGRDEAKMLSNNIELSIPPESIKQNTLPQDGDVHMLPCGESGKWKYIRMYQERARRREARRKRQKEREKSQGKGTSKRRKSRKRSKSSKRRKSKSRSRSGKRSKSGAREKRSKSRPRSGKRGKSGSRKKSRSKSRPRSGKKSKSGAKKK